MIDKKKTIFISFATLLQILFGFLLQITIANKIGFSQELDLYFITISIGFIFIVVFNTAISYGVTAIFTNMVKKRNFKRLNLVSNSLINYMILLFMIIFFILNVFIEDLIHLLYKNDIQNILLIKKVFFYYSIGVIFSVISLIGVALNYAYSRFYLSSLSFSIDFLIQLIVVVFLIDDYGIVALSIAFMFGQIVKATLLMLNFLRYYRFYLNFKIIKKMILVNIMPLTFSSFYSNTNLLLDKYFASKFNVGDISILQYSMFISAAVTSILSKGLSILSLNALSNKSIKEQHEIIYKNVKVALYIFLIYLLIYFFVGKYVLMFIFTFTDKINENDVELIFNIILILSIKILFNMLASIINNLYYNNNLVKQLSLISIISQTINIILKIYIFSDYGIIGLAVGTSLQAILSFSIIYIYYFHFISKGKAIYERNSIFKF